MYSSDSYSESSSVTSESETYYDPSQVEEEVFVENEERSSNVIMDVGSGIFKAGFAGEDYPSVCFPTIVGTEKVWNEEDYHRLRKLREERRKLNEPLDDFVVGSEVLDDMMDLKISYPTKRGRIDNWEQMEFVFEHVFLNELDCDPENCNILLTEAPLSSRKSREEIATLLFETFRVNGIQIMNQAILSLYSTGRTTGLVLDCGDQVSHCVPIFEGYLLPHHMRRLNLGGRDVTLYLERIMLERGYDFRSSAEHQIAREIKEKIGYVSLNFNEELEGKEVDKVFQLPDGYDIKLGHELFRAPEILFTPSLVGNELNGVSDMVYESFFKCGYDIRDKLYSQIVLAGGSTLFPGFPERLLKDLNNLEKNFRTFKVIAPETRQFSCWIGGSIFASLSSFEEQLITIEDFEEDGISCLSRSHANKMVNSDW